DILRKYVADTGLMLHREVKGGRNILFEGAQGTLLDVDHGTYPFVTSSSTCAGGACTGTGVSPREIHEIIGISKAYVTRVGSGPFPTELLEETGEKMRQAGNEFGSTTGRPRRCGWFDAVVLRYAVHPYGIAEHDGVKPAAAARPASGRPEFVARLTHLFSGFLKELCRERAAADTRDVGF